MRIEYQWRSFFGLNKTILEEHDMFRSKPNVVSVCGGMWRALSFAKPIKRHWFHNESSDVLKGGILYFKVRVFVYSILFVFYLCFICILFVFI